MYSMCTCVHISFFQRKHANIINCGLTFDIVKQIALCDIISSGMTFFSRRVMLAFCQWGVYPIDLLEVEMIVKEYKDKVCQEGTNND